MSKTHALAKAAAFASLTAVSAFLKLPIGTVPITLQTFFVYVAGGVLGGYAGGLSQLIYLFIGVAGLPVFAGPVAAGFGALFGPTGGYLAGFVVAAYLIGRLTELKSGLRLRRILMALLMGTGIIYLLGVAQLSLILGSWRHALLIGLLPFLPGDAAKIVAASFVILKVRGMLAARPVKSP